MGEKSTEQSVTKLDGAGSACGKFDAGNEAGNKEKENEDRSEQPNIVRVFPAPPGSDPAWRPSPGTHNITSDLMDHDSAAEDEYVIIDKI